MESDQMESFWMDDSIREQCRNSGIVALRIVENSETARQFSQIYPVSIIPSLFLIGRNGVPLDIITPTSHLNRDLFNTTITKAIQNHQMQSMSFRQLEKSATNIDENVEQVKELLDDKKVVNEAKLQHEEREKEMNKRQQDVEQHRREKELKDCVQERRKEKNENKSTLQKLRQQIVVDRMDTRNRGQQQPIDISCRKNNFSSSLTAVLNPESSDTNWTRIQCRFSDGTRLVHAFPPSALFNDVVALIDADGRQSGPFHLVQMYPRREFDELDLQRTLVELELSPSSVLIVIPIIHPITSTPLTGLLSQLFKVFTWPFAYTCQLLVNMFRGGRSIQQRIENRDTSSSTVSDPGNAHRLIHPSDDDDNTATWNGNSTQQL